MSRRKKDDDTIEQLRKKWKKDNTWICGFLHEFQPEVSPRHMSSRSLCKNDNNISVKTILESCRMMMILSAILNNNLSTDHLITLTLSDLEQRKLLTPKKRVDFISSLSECVTVLDSSPTLSPTFLLKLPRESELFQTISTYMFETIKHHRKNHSGFFNNYNILSIEQIRNEGAWNKYTYRRDIVRSENNGNANEHLLFHASPSYMDVIRMGFDERFCSTSAMFGCGVYYADVSSKSNLYVHGEGGGNGCEKHHDKACHQCPRHMLLCRVALGAAFTCTSADTKINHPPPGHHSVVGVPSPGFLHHPEFVTYRGEQGYAQFLLTYQMSTIPEE